MKGKTIDDVRQLVSDCIMSNNEEILVALIYELGVQYVELARLASLDEYKEKWTHSQLLDYITKEL